jgi:hypothetical protein
MRLWLPWVAASFGGGTTAAALLLPAWWLLLPELRVILAGAAIGLAQWLVLRRRIPSAWWWIIASVLGLFLGLWMRASVYVYFWFSPHEEAVWVKALADSALGATLGTMQWFVVRRIDRNYLWILASALGLGLAGLAGPFADLAAAGLVRPASDMAMYRHGDFVSVLVEACTYGAVSGIVTGSVLAWLMWPSPRPL